MTYEAPENPDDLLIKGNPVGRPRKPEYHLYLDPVMRLFVQIRTRMERTGKPVTNPEIKGWLMQLRLLQVAGYDIKVTEFENPGVEDVLAVFKVPEPEKKPEEAKPIVSAFPKDL